METSQAPTEPVQSPAWVHPLRRRILVVALVIFTAVIVVVGGALMLVISKRVDADNRGRAEELASVVLGSMSHLMMERDPDGLQETLERMPASRDAPLRAFLLNPDGKVAFSSERADRGRMFGRVTEPSCVACHGDPGKPRDRTTLLIGTGGNEFQRSVILIPNEPRCHSCHAPSQRLLGKLVIDRSMRDARALLRDIELVVGGAGLVCLLLGLPLLARALGRYVTAITHQSSELGLLYLLTDRLSRTIEPHELNVIIAAIVEEIFEGDEAVLMLPRGDEVRCYCQTRGSDELRRLRVRPGDPLSALAERWRAGQIEVGALSADGTELLIPIGKDSRRLALIVVRRRAPYHAWRQRIAVPVAHHIAVALENARLFCLAITDELTGLYARRHFSYSVEKLLNAEHAGGPIFSLAMIDIDNFKAVNDAHGHPAGDAVLRAIAQALQQSVRDNDLVFRYGGEEFVVLLASCGARAGLSAAERMRLNVERTVCRHESLELRVTVSIGLADSVGMRTMEEMVKAADTSLYEAKHSGKNCVVVSGMPDLLGASVEPPKPRLKAAG